MRIDVVEEVTSDVVEAFARLLPQLSTSAPPLSTEDLNAVVAADATTLFVAVSGDAIVGALTLAMFKIPTGLRAWIEDVVVDERARGEGIGTALTLHAIDHAGEHGARTVDLTSRPSRAAANAMYAKAGFARRDTTVYRFTVSVDG